MAHGLLRATANLDDGCLENFRAMRYAGWDGQLGKLLANANLASAANLVIKNNLDPQPRSGRQEWLENLFKCV